MATASPTRPAVFNLPNQLTAARLVFGVALFALIAERAWTWCVVVFAAAAITDWLDGYAARLQGISSALGRVFDPLVDKVLICGAYIFLVPIAESGLTAWMATVVVARELIINGLRSFLESRGTTFGADWLGKVKMVLQCAALFAIFVALGVRDSGASEANVAFFARLSDGLVYAMLGATALSGFQYLWRAALILRAEREL